MSRHCPSLAPGPAPPLDNEDLLQEILLRLPPQPSSLPRVSLVCKHWRSILSDPNFIQLFRKHHRKPPLLGFFVGPCTGMEYIFTPVMDQPDHVPSTRFSMPQTIPSEAWEWHFKGCRHGLAVLISRSAAAARLGISPPRPVAAAASPSPASADAPALISFGPAPNRPRRHLRSKPSRSRSEPLDVRSARGSLRSRPPEALSARRRSAPLRLSPLDAGPLRSVLISPG
ncbi:hypothetical protein QYE76_019294 [Lolium multiflorum]|uniref:F-box domain-containing protein n=1 Tax=Lolium multiflorum TaxID=4521 RepID=A0AAD8R3S5_LOLMU|nr:hypothetical protein QYE76_019294 [Lolium multiflorum]